MGQGVIPHGPKVRAVEDDSAVDLLRTSSRQMPRQNRAPVMADQGERRSPYCCCEAEHVVSQHIHHVGPKTLGLAGEIVAALVGHQDAKASRRERLDLMPPAIPELREAMQQNDQRPVSRASRHGMKRHAVRGQAHVLVISHEPVPLK